MVYIGHLMLDDSLVETNHALFCCTVVLPLALHDAIAGLNCS